MSFTDPLITSAFAAMRSGAPFIAPPPHLPADDVAALARLVPVGHLGVFSSGSASRPRCILRTWASWTDSFAVIDARLEVRPGERIGLTGPSHSTMMLFAALHALHHGAQPVWGDDLARADVIHAVPTKAIQLLDDIATGLRRAPRRLVIAGAAAPASLWERAHAAGVSITEYFGAAETSFIAWRDRPGPFDPIPEIDVAVRDGVIWVRSRFLAEGYLLPDASTPEGPLTRDGEWVSVGDHGEWDATGGLVVRGRGDTAVTTAGHTVVVEDVEAVLADLPGVHEVAVVGTPHELLGEVMTAVIVGTITDDELRRAVSALPSHARPRAWLHREELPHLPGGKIDRASLRAEVST